MQMSMKNLSFQLQPVKSKSRMVKGLIIQLLVLGQNVPHTFTFLQEFGSVKFTNVFFFFFLSLYAVRGGLSGPPCMRLIAWHINRKNRYLQGMKFILQN